MSDRRRRPDAASGIDDDLAALSAVGLGPDAPLWNDARLLVDGRLLAAVHGRLVDALGEEEAYWRLYQVGVVHGLRDAARVAAATAQTPPRPVEAGAVASLPLAMTVAPPGPAAEAPAAGLALVGEWPEGVEAAARLSACGVAARPACGLSAGYTAGWLSGMQECDVLVMETRCCARGDADCRFEAREAEDWHASSHGLGGRVPTLLERVPLEAFRRAASEGQVPAGPLPAQAELPAGAAVVDVWGPVMVLPFADPDDALRLVEVVRHDPSTREVRVVVIDLRGLPLDTGFGAASLERALETLEEWGAEAVLTGVSPLAEAAVRPLEDRHLVLRKDAAEAIAAAFQIAEAQRRVL